MRILNTALAGLQRSATGIHVVAQNIANVHTDGYRAQRFDPATGSTVSRHGDPPGGQDGDAAGSRQPSDVDLATELVDLSRYEAGYRASATVLVVAERMNGEMLDLFA